MSDMNKDLNRMDDALKHALQRQEVPDGFTGRVLARVAAGDSPRRPVSREPWLGFFTQPLVRWAALAAVAVAMVLGVKLYNDHRERVEGEAAKQRLMLALRVAGSKLQLAKAKINEMNAGQSTNRQVKE